MRVASWLHRPQTQEHLAWTNRDRVPNFNRSREAVYTKDIHHHMTFSHSATSSMIQPVILTYIDLLPLYEYGCHPQPKTEQSVPEVSTKPQLKPDPTSS